MNTALFASGPAAIQTRVAPLAGLKALLQRWLAPAAPRAPQRLDKGATTWIAQPLGRIIRCETGTLWLTFDGEPLDLILEAGQSHRCDKASRLGIHAMSAACLSVGFGAR